MIRYETIWYDKILYETMWYDMIQNDMIWYKTIRNDMLRYEMMRNDVIRYKAIRNDMVRYETIWYNAICNATIHSDTIRYDIQYNAVHLDLACLLPLCNLKLFISHLLRIIVVSYGVCMNACFTVSAGYMIFNFTKITWWNKVFSNNINLISLSQSLLVVR